MGYAVDAEVRLSSKAIGEAMSLPPWYRIKRRPLAETLLTLDLSRTTGIGPLTPGLVAKWDMTPYLCASDPAYRVRAEVDAEGRKLNIMRRRKHVATVYLAHDPKRIGAPLRALCGCGRRCYRLYLWGSHFRCGECLRVTYASGQRSTRERALARMQRLEYRLECTENLPRHRGRRKIEAKLSRLDARLFATMPLNLLQHLTNLAS